MMDTPLDRRAVLLVPCLAIAGTAAARASAFIASPAQPPAPAAADWPGFPRQDPALVGEFVGASHANIARVREMLAVHPALAKCAYDWGYGDWESALGAASHVGNREIALLLLEHGARLDLFAATMLGMTDVVRAIVAARPGVERTPGPHGIKLLGHARAGKDPATIAFVEPLFAADPPPPAALTDAEIEIYTGEYKRPGAEAITVNKTNFGMGLKAPTSIDRTLIRTGDHTFHPVGAPNVRVTFTIRDGLARRIEIVEPPWFIAASRD